MTKIIIQSIRVTIVMTALTGIAYPLAVTGLSQVLFRDKANGSLIPKDGKMVGSELLAQQFTGAKYFWPRPSACGYGTVASGASNLGPTSQALQSNLANNAAAFIAGNKLATNAVVPSDMIFTSGSGLDPHISPEAARLQIARVAGERKLDPTKVADIVEKFIEPSQLGFLGEPRVNVLKLNLALDAM